MKKLYLLIIIFFAVAYTGYAQFTRHIIQLKDKKGTVHELSNPSLYLSPKAIQRRSRQQISIDSTDIPVSVVYLDSIKQVPNVVILNASKWLNQVLIRTSDAAALAKINSFPFVKTVAPIASIAMPGNGELINPKFDESIYPIPQRSPVYGTKKMNEVNDQISYGNTFNQVHIHEGEYLHNLGFRGQGIMISVLDAGYSSILTNPAYDSLRMQNRLLGGYDFVTNQPVISQAHSHGSQCLSTMAANRPGAMVGTAPSASYWLLRTEDAASEFPVEEHNWAVAAEFADSAGTDLISSSLGYITFTDPSFNHTYADRDGNTCMSTIAADLAAKKGIIVMNSAGNSGGSANDEKFIGCPADGDSVVAVGAIRADATIAGFSSWGPNSAGKVKPNLVSIGQGAIIANSSGNPVASNGTSFSNPNLAGLFACLWQAFPEFTNMEIIDAVQKSADRYENPDIRFGYGIPNFRIAYQLLETEKVRRNAINILGTDWIKAYPVPFKTNFNILLKAPNSGQAQVRLMDVSGKIIEMKSIQTIQNDVYFIQFSIMERLAAGMYFVQYFDNKTSNTIRVMKQY